MAALISEQGEGVIKAAAPLSSRHQMRQSRFVVVVLRAFHLSH